jgi:hypothetical protein
MVWSADAESLEQAARVKRIIGGKRKCRIGRMCGICPGNGNTRVYLFAFDSMRLYRIAAYVWICPEDRRDGAELDDG